MGGRRRDMSVRARAPRHLAGISLPRAEGRSLRISRKSWCDRRTDIWFNGGKVEGFSPPAGELSRHRNVGLLV